MFLLAAFSPSALLGHLTVFALAIVIGYYVIGHVHHALHTPLMSVTNAISGIIVVGALLQIGHGDDNGVITALAFVAILLASHQRLRRLRGDPSDARHVLEELRPTDSTMTTETAAQAAYIVAALLFILALAGLSQHETAKAGNTFGMAGMALALVATIALAIDRDISGTGLVLLVVAMVVGAAIGLWRARVVEMTGMPELIALLHSFVGLAAVLVGWNGYLHVEAELRRRATCAGPGATGLARGGPGPARDPLRRGVHRGLHRCGHLHRVDRGLPQAVGADQVQPADAAGQEPAQPGCPGRVRGADGLVRDRPAAVAAGRGDRWSPWRWAGTWSPPSAAVTCRSWSRC